MFLAFFLCCSLLLADSKLLFDVEVVVVLYPAPPPQMCSACVCVCVDVITSDDADQTTFSSAASRRPAELQLSMTFAEQFIKRSRLPFITPRNGALKLAAAWS